MHISTVCVNAVQNAGDGSVETIFSAIGKQGFLFYYCVQLCKPEHF